MCDREFHEQERMPLPKNKGWQTQVDHERSSFYPQSYAQRATMYIIMQINSKSKGGLGRGRKKDDRRGFIVF